MSIAEIVSSAISTLALILSIVLAISQFRARSESKYNIYAEYMNGLMRWFEDVTKIQMSIINNVEEKSKQQYLADLSALIEIGRFYFPNIDKEDALGDFNPTAYQGYRNLVLDYLVWFFDAAKTKDDINRMHTRLVALQREFTSAVYEVVQPQQRLDDIKGMTGRYLNQDLTMEDYFVEHNM
jgi:hypothetical protein